MSIFATEVMPCLVKLTAMAVTVVIATAQLFRGCGVAAVAPLLLALAWDVSMYRVVGGNVFHPPLTGGKLAILTGLPGAVQELLIG